MSLRCPASLQRDLPYEVSSPALRTLGQTVSVPSEAPYFGAHYRVTQVRATWSLCVALTVHVWCCRAAHGRALGKQWGAVQCMADRLRLLRCAVSDALEMSYAFPAAVACRTGIAPMCVRQLDLTPSLACSCASQEAHRSRRLLAFSSVCACLCWLICCAVPAAVACRRRMAAAAWWPSTLQSEAPTTASMCLNTTRA